MKGQAIVFTEPGKVELREIEVDLDNLAPNGIVVQTEASVVSAGTELAILRGSESWARLPRSPGYGNVGKVLAVGAEVKRCKSGDRILSYAHHASPAKTSTRFAMQVPDDLDPKLAVMARMGQVAFTSVRVSNVELGDWVAVQGLGLVGNLAAQLMALSGATVIGIDISPRRLQAAKSCGIHHVVNPAQVDPVEAVRELTGGKLCHTVVEATGIPDLALTASQMAGKWGETILLGTPRGEFTADGLALLSQVHLWGNGCVTLKGAHEWRYPIYDPENGMTKHSIERNVQIFWDLLRQGKVHVRELISHVVDPTRCSEVYRNLAERNEEYFGVIFDWTGSR